MTPLEHTDCRAFAENSANAFFPDDLGGRMRVTRTRPPVSAPDYPPQRYACPHGHRYWVWPDADRIAALDDINARAAATGGGGQA